MLQKYTVSFSAPSTVLIDDIDDVEMHETSALVAGGMQTTSSIQCLDF